MQSVPSLARAGLLILSTAGLLVTSLAVGTPAEVSASIAVTRLASLRVAAPSHASTFDPQAVKVWADADHDCRNTRAEVLARDSSVAVHGCVISSGRWVSVLDGKPVRNAKQLTVVREVPLASAWTSGGWAWSPRRWQAYANDVGYRWSLIATTPASNAARAGRGPDRWLPPSSACRYGTAWVAVKARWRLSVTKAEKAALTKLLASCSSSTASAASTGAVVALPAPRITALTGPTTESTKFGAHLDVDPDGKLPYEAKLLAAGGSPYASAVRTIAKYPEADWSDQTSGAKAQARYRANAAASRGALVTLTIYNIPHRDPGSFSAGGAHSAAEYRNYIDQITAGLGSHRAIIILEPDALLQLDKLTAAQQTERISLLRYGVRTLTAHGSWVYLDVGNLWPNAKSQARLLKKVGVRDAAGFSLNVANYDQTSDLISRGTAVSKLLGSPTHFILDTSRNGVVNTTYDWCNAMPRGLGHAPTTITGNPLVDAYLWVKPPGDSDGPCNGGPAAGTFWPAYAQQLVTNAKLG